MKHYVQNDVKHDINASSIQMNKKYKVATIIILSIQIILTIWTSYLIANGALSFIKNPLSHNILDHIGMLYIFWFISLFIALAYKYDVLFNHKELFKKRKTDINKDKTTSEFKEHILPSILLFIIAPIISAVALYYIIYYIIFLFIGILPYIAGIGILLGLIYSIIKLPRIAHKNGRGLKTVLFTILMLMAYSLLLILIYQKELGIGTSENNVAKREFVIYR